MKSPHDTICVLSEKVFQYIVFSSINVHNFFCYNFSQLFYDGHQQLAVNLATTVKAHPACPPSDRLLKVIKMGLKVEEGMITREISDKNLIIGT